jgi:hypothetical protein
LALQPGVALAGAVHGVHDVPHELGEVLSEQRPLQLWKPELHAVRHWVPSQVTVALGGVAHALHDAPQLAVERLLTQFPPQLW